MGIISGGGGGGTAEVVGAHVHLAGVLHPYPGGAVGFTTIDLDTDSFWSAGDKAFLIPVGLGGLYLIQCGMVAAPDPDNIVGAVCDINISNTAWNISPISFELQESLIDLGPGTFRGYIALVLPLSAGCLINPSVYWKGDSGYGPPSPDGDLWPRSYFGIFRQGDLP